VYSNIRIPEIVFDVLPGKRALSISTVIAAPETVVLLSMTDPSSLSAPCTAYFPTGEFIHASNPPNEAKSMQNRQIFASP
jgi:hypothetical protein